MPEPRFTAIVLDLDGTLIDSAPDLRSALNRLLAAEALEALSLEQVTGMVGDGVRVLVTRGFAALDRSLAEDELDAKCADFLKDYEGNGAVLTRPYPGVVETLQILKDNGHALAVCTNKPTHAAREILGELGMAGFFGVVVGGGELEGILKPDPRPLLETLRRMGVDPGRAVMVGDSKNDMETARAAGVASIAVAYGYAKGPLADLGAGMVIESFNELPETLERL